MQNVIVVIQMVKAFEPVEVCIGLTWHDAISCSELAYECHYISYGVMVFS